MANPTVSVEDQHLLSRYNWYRHSRGYFARKAKDGRTVLLHREIMQPPKGLVVDHINRDKNDNRRSNLRVCTQAENCANSKYRPNKTGYLGVYLHKASGLFHARITRNGKTRSLGYYKTKEQAGEARKIGEQNA